jgi:phage gp29-like protein
MARPVLLGPDGQPIRREILRQEISAPTLTGIRTIWNDTVASGLTPMRLASLLQRAAEGDAGDYLTLAEEMEEREPHYAAVLGIRKRALSGLEPAVAAATDDPRDVAIADELRNLVSRPAFGELVDELLDALGKGYSVCEIIWETGRHWRPTRYLYRDPRWFRFDRTDGRTLLLVDDGAPLGRQLEPYKFITHVPRLKSGLPIRGGLARLVAWSFMFKFYALKDWMAFVELFGLPLRLGRYGKSATEKDIDTLWRAVANIGTDAAAVIPEEMRIEFIDAAKGQGGHELFQRLADWIDRQVSKAVLGQTMTSDDGSSRSQAEVHNEVRHDILRADARQLAITINRDLVRPFVDLNWGPQQHYPVVSFPVMEPEDLQALVTALKELVPLGLTVETSVIRDKLNLPDPEPDAELLAAPVAAPTAAENRDHAVGCPCCAPARASNAETSAEDVVDEIEREALAEWDQQLAPVIDPVRQLLEECSSYEEALARLPELLGRMDSRALVEALTQAFFSARAAGDVDA